MDRLLLDLKLAFRRLRQNPAFAIVAILTLALGVGANTAVFSVLNAIFLKPLPVRNSSELVSLNQTMGGNTFPTISFPNYRDIRDRNTVVDGLVSYRILPASLGLPGASQRVWGYLVTGNYFDVLGISAVQGRLFRPDDDIKPGGHPLAVISYACWQKRFGGDPAVIGSTVRVNGQEFTLLGVAPKSFFGTELFYTPDIYFPMMMQKELEGGSGQLHRREVSNYFVLGRLKPGVSLKQAESGFNSIARKLEEEYPESNGGMKILLTPPGLAGNYIRGAVIGFTAAMFGVSSLVLLIACTNLASMLLARAADRRKDTAIRLALGAGRFTLVRQLLTENLVVALAGGFGGALVAFWITEALASWRPPIDIPLTVAVSADMRVFFFALLISTFTTVLFGLVPALQSTRTSLVPALKNEAASERLRHWHLRDYMVATQVGLSAILLVCSVLVVRSLQRSLEAPLGYNPRGAVTASFDLNIQGYKETEGRSFQRRLLERLRNTPGIESVALVDWLPLSLNNSNDSIYIEGKPKPKASDAPIAFAFSVSPDYFRTMQTRILSGREFTFTDKQDGPRVAVVNSTFAEKLLPGEDPIGKRFTTGPGGKPWQIVGVAEDGKYLSLNEKRGPAFWAPIEQSYSANAAVVARTKISSTEALQQIRAAFRELDPSVAQYAAGPLSEHLDLPLFPARLAAAALGAFGVLVLILAATGIYGVMAYAVSRRTREIGIRMAIGASPQQVLGSIARSATILVGSGTVVGLIVALVLGGLLKQILFGVDPTDPATYGIVGAMMAAIAALACWLPARRATRIDPIRALRQE